MLPHPASFYGPPRDTIINSRSDDADDQDYGAAVGIPSPLTNYQFLFGTPDLKPSQAHHIPRDSRSREHLQEPGNSDVIPGLPQ